MLVLDKYYKVVFETDYTALSAVYKVLRAVSYTTIVDEEIDLVEYFYGKVGKTEAEMLYDIGNHTNSIFYKMQSAEDDTDVIWVPEKLISGYPDPNVKEYTYVMLSTDLGVCDDTDNMVAVNQAVSRTVKSLVGTSVIEGDPITLTVDPVTAINVYKTSWLTETEYNAIVAARVACMNVANQDRPVNYFVEYNLKVLECARLQDKVTMLENLVAQLDQG